MLVGNVSACACLPKQHVKLRWPKSRATQFKDVIMCGLLSYISISGISIILFRLISLSTDNYTLHNNSIACCYNCFTRISQLITSPLLALVNCVHRWGGGCTKMMSTAFIIPPPNEVGGGYTGFTLSVRLSVCPSVCRRHGFRSISQVCFRISISNFICMLMVAIGRSLLIFSDVTFKMAAWRPYWIFWFPDSNFTSALNINFKLQRHNTYVYG